MRVPLLVCLLATLVSSVVATPARARSTTKKTTSTTAVATTAPTATSMHDCSVFIERWTYYDQTYEKWGYGNSYVFDISYYEYNWTYGSPGNLIETQETPPLKVGAGFDRAMGSHTLRVVNTANPASPAPVNPADPGRVTVTWGNWVGKSWDPSTGCRENVYRTGPNYLCYFQCDVPFGT